MKRNGLKGSPSVCLFFVCPFADLDMHFMETLCSFDKADDMELIQAAICICLQTCVYMRLSHKTQVGCFEQPLVGCLA